MTRRLALAAVIISCSPTPAPVNAPAPPLPATAPAPAPLPPTPRAAAVEDPYLWLEQIDDARSLEWVRGQNGRSKSTIEAVAGFAKTQQRIRAILDAKDKVPWVTKRGEYLYNFWQDDAHKRGLWRRTTLAEYRKAEPRWDVMVDIDALNTAENASWVFQGANCLYPRYERCLISLSRGGSDATVVREFDLAKRAFVAAGFALPEAKSIVSWKDLDTIFVGTDFGPGSMTKAGYPRIVKEWKRGTPLAAAATVFEGKDSDVAVGVVRQWDHHHVHDLFNRDVSFFQAEQYYWDGKAPAKLDKPDDVAAVYWDDQILFSLRKDWTIGGTTWPGGSLLAIGERDYLAGDRAFTPLFTPTPTTSLNTFVGAKTVLYVAQLEDVKDGLVAWTRTGTGKARAWKSTRIALPTGVASEIAVWDNDENDDYWMSESGFITPASVSLVSHGRKEVLKRTPARFDAAGLEVTQHFVTSKDGTRVPYFMVARKQLALDGNAPALIEGYGGFEVSLTPWYSPTVGAAWLERGGVFVVPNLRGGSEYGPQWHEAATKLNRQRVYDDFAAVAEDLIQRKITRPGKLGILGGSNGGLLVGVMMTERPELFGAVVCEAPLLDMKRYNQLLAGASWMEEYGDPAVPEEWAAIARYSPYQNVKPGVAYPPVLFTTSTRDDRVHPGHARKMAARMLEQGHPDVLFYENIEGGHAGAADSEQQALMSTLAYAFLWKTLGVGADGPAAKQ